MAAAEAAACRLVIFVKKKKHTHTHTHTHTHALAHAREHARVYMWRRSGCRRVYMCTCVGAVLAAADIHEYPSRCSACCLSLSHFLSKGRRLGALYTSSASTFGRMHKDGEMREHMCQSLKSSASTIGRMPRGSSNSRLELEEPRMHEP